MKDEPVSQYSTLEITKNRLSYVLKNKNQYIKIFSSILKKFLFECKILLFASLLEGNIIQLFFVCQTI